MGVNFYTKDGWLDFDKILNIADKTPFVFICGARGVGKTFAALTTMLNKDVTFMLLRRTNDEYEICSKDESSPFKDIMLTGAIKPVVLKTIAKGLTGIYEAVEDENGDLVAGSKLKGYIACLQNFYKVRSSSFADVEALVYDEFIPEKHVRKFNGGTVSEYMAYFNVYESICRNREEFGRPPVKAICMANANDLGNALYQGFKLIPKAEQMTKKHQNVSIDYDKGICMIHLTNSPISFRKRNHALYKATAGNTEFNAMALENRFYRDDSAVIRPRKLEEFKPICSIYGIYIYAHKSDRVFYVSNHKSGRFNNFGTSSAEKKRFLNNYMFLWWAYLANRVEFEDYAALVSFEEAYSK